MRPVAARSSTRSFPARLTCTLLLTTLAVFAQPPDSPAAHELNPRGGAPDLFAKLQRGEAVTIAFFGGSITAADGWRPLVFDWFRKQFPAAHPEMLPASVGGTGSLVGAFRADDDLVRHQPDLVFVEFAVNDAGDARTQPEAVRQALEGIVRKLRRARPATGIVFVYTLQGPDVDTLNAGRYQNAAALHEEIAGHYNIPSIHLGIEVARMVRNRQAVFTAPATTSGKTEDGAVIFTNDGTHPTALGHALYAEAAIRGLEALRQIPGEQARDLPPPLAESNWEQARTLPAHGNARFTGEWEKLTAENGPSCFRFGKKFYEWFPFLYRTRAPGSSLTVRFRGTHIGLKSHTGPESGIVTIQVDGGPPVRENQFTVYSRMPAYIGGPLPALKDGVHTVTWTFSAEKPDKGQILASYYRPGNDKDFREHPERYADHTFTAGQILVIGELLPPEIPARFVVSPDGDDIGSGHPDRPFATLARARDAARAAGLSHITLRGGVYPLTESFKLTAADSNSTWRAADGETVVLTNAVVVPPAELRPVSDSNVLHRLDESARPHVVEIDAAKLGLQHVRRFPDNFNDNGGLIDLYHDGKRLALARWPNKGYAKMVRVTDNGDWSNGSSRRGGAFLYEGSRPERWLRAVESGLWLDGFWRVPWAPEKVRVASIDTAAKEIRHAVPVNLGIGSKYARPSGDGKEPWYALNVIEEIDLPGEWAIDFATRKIYVWPPGPGEFVIADRSWPLLSIEGASGVRIEGLTFEGGLGNGVEVKDGSAVVIAGSKFRRLGGAGAVISGGAAHGVLSCDFEHLGNGGVSLSGGDRRTLTPAGHFVVNSYMHHLGEVRKTYAPAVNIAFGAPVPAVGVTVANNLIHDLPHAAVLYSGNDHLFERNEVHNVALDSGDVGAFYTTNDWTSRGNILRHNFVHHSTGANAFYLDDGDSGDRVEQNLIYRTAYGPFIGGGHDNVVRANLVVAARRCLHLDARGIARHYNTSDTHKMKLLQSVDYQRPPWSVRYPELLRILDHPEFPSNNLLENNALVGCTEPFHLDQAEDLSFSTIRANTVMPLDEATFVNAAELDFRLLPNSPLGKEIPQLREIPFAHIGLYLDAFRRRLPSAAETGRNNDRREDEPFDSNTDLKGK